MAYEFKIILLGEPGVGKTSLIQTYASGKFNTSRKKTKVVSLMSKEIMLKEKKVKFCIWDTSSREFFKNVVPNYYDGFLLVYDVTNMASFDALLHWMELLKKKTNDEAATLVVGNKIDLSDSTVVSHDAAMKFTIDKNLDLIESSAKNGNNVTEIFEHLAFKIIKSKRLDWNNEQSCDTSMSSTYSKIGMLSEDEPSSTPSEQILNPSSVIFPDRTANEHPEPDSTEPENESSHLRESNLEPQTLSRESQVQIIANETNNHNDTLEIPRQNSVRVENSYSNTSESNIANGDDTDEIESSFVFVSFLPPILSLPGDIPLLQVRRRRTSADSVLSLMTVDEMNSV